MAGALVIIYFDGYFTIVPFFDVHSIPGLEWERVTGKSSRIRALCLLIHLISISYTAKLPISSFVSSHLCQKELGGKHSPRIPRIMRILHCSANRAWVASGHSFCRVRRENAYSVTERLALSEGALSHRTRQKECSAQRWAMRRD
jgi:hypothetical protein